MGGRTSTPVIEISGPRRNSYDVAPQQTKSKGRMGQRGSTHSLPNNAGSNLQRHPNLGVNGSSISGRQGGNRGSRSNSRNAYNREDYHQRDVLSRGGSLNTPSRSSNVSPFSNFDYESDFESDEDDKHNITLSNHTLTRMKLLRKKKEAMKHMEDKIAREQSTRSLPSKTPPMLTPPPSKVKSNPSTPFSRSTDRSNYAKERQKKFKELQKRHGQNSLSISNASSEESGLSVKPNLSYKKRNARPSPRPSPRPTPRPSPRASPSPSRNPPVSYGRVPKSQSYDRLSKLKENKTNVRRRNGSLDRNGRTTLGNTPRSSSTRNLNQQRNVTGSSGSLTSRSRYSGVSTTSRRSTNSIKPGLERSIDDLILAMGTARVRSPGQLSSTMSKNMKPFPVPREGLQDAKDLLQTDDWEDQVEGIQSIIRLCTFHPDELSSDLHEVNLLMLTQAKNLRSQVSRAAVQGFMHLFDNMKKQMEYDMDKIVNLLLAKTADTNKFIKSDCNNALDAIIENTTPAKAIPVIIQEGVGHRHAMVRTTAARLLAYSVEKMGGGRVLSGQKEVTEKLLPAAAKLAQDGNLDVRKYTKMIFLPLMQHPNFEMSARKYINPTDLKNIQKFLDNLSEGRMIQDSAQSKAPVGSRLNRSM